MPRIDPAVDAHRSAAQSAGGPRIDVAAAPFAAIVDAARDPARARLCKDVVLRLGLPASSTLQAATATLVWAAGAGARGEEGLVTPIQAARALECLHGAAPALQEAFAALSTSAASDGERAVLLKALAARSERRGEPGIGKELAAIAKQVRGQSLDWLLEHTTVRETTTRPGLRQAWTTSCVPTVKLLAEAEHDPAIALRITRDAATMNAIDSFSSLTQRDTLEQFGGMARARATDDPAPQERRGPLAAWMGGLLKSVERTVFPGEGASMGQVMPALADVLAGEVERIPRAKFDAAILERIVDDVRRGEDVPLRIEPKDGEGPGHAVIVVDCVVAGDERTFRVHDPATGRTVPVDARALLVGTLLPTKAGAVRHVTDVYFLHTGSKSL